MQSPNPTTFTANEIIKAGARVTLRSDGKIENSSATGREIGVALLYNGKDSYAAGDSVGVLLYFQSVICIAGAAISACATVGRTSAGKVIAGSGFGIAAESAAADGDNVEVYLLPSGDIGAAPAALTDSSTGASGGATVPAVTNPDLSAWNGSTDPSAAQATAINAAITALKNDVATLAAKINAIIAALG